jgi:hypothetical protein
LRLEALLRGVDLHPPGLAPSAVLCVRSLPDPLPGALPVSQFHLRAPPRWEQAARESLARLARAAARPYRQAVPDSAEAVLFQDWAELLACFAADWAEGRAASRWWWRGLFNLTGLPARDVLVSRLIERPECTPAVVAHLAAQSLLPVFLPRVPPPRLREISLRMATAWAVEDVWIDVECALTEGTQSERWMLPAPTLEALASEPPPAAAPAGAGDVTPPPWHPWAPEAVQPSFDVVQQTFLVVALMLYRQPARLRAPAFRRQIQEWRAASAAVSAIASMPSVSTAASLDAAVPPELAQQPVAPAPRPALARAPAVQAQPVLAVPVPPTEQPLVYEPPAAPPPPLIRPGPADSAREPTPALKSSQQPAIPATSVHPEPLETGFGGLFYLINIGIHLRLYGDFTMPLEPGMPLQIWDFLVLLGCRLLERENPSDRVWPLLAALAGRGPQDAPGAGFDPPPDWRGDPDWPPPPSGSLEEWFDWLAECLQPRLRSSLRLAEDRSLSQVLLEQPAQLYVTDTRLDAVFSLASHPIEIRIAGWDRDPGWVPAAGRIIAFHFE